MLGGAVVVETIFGWPGMGRMTVNAALQQGYPLVLGVGMFFAVLTIVGNLLSDIFYGLVDPRLRWSSVRDVSADLNGVERCVSGFGERMLAADFEAD